MKRVYIVHSDTFYHNMWVRLGCEVVDSLLEADIVQFTGGEDVSPELYHENNVASYNNTDRDAAEVAVFREAVRLGKLMVGICRGGQFLNVMSGGSMWQHCDGHTRTHRVLDIKTGEHYTCTSTHHQMMRASDEGELVCVAYPKIGSNFICDGDTAESVEDEVECVWYEHTKCLCFQPHPEWGGNDGTFWLFSNLVKRFLGV